MKTVVLISLAVIVIAALATYATFLLLKLRKQRFALAEIEKQKQRNQLDKDIGVLSSIILISKAVNQKQCEISEGCWRLSVLIESLPSLSAQFKNQYPAIFKLYESINHMPILEKRNALTKQERLKLDLQRMGIEQELEGSVLSAIAELEPHAISVKESLQEKLT